ncbi:MAG: hypothetical protein QXZ09_07880 [Candidatus Methanomethylicaceae archaeon]
MYDWLAQFRIHRRLRYLEAIIRNGVVLILASASVQLLNIFIGLMIVRSTSLEQYAVYVLGSTIFAIGSVLATMSVPSAVIFFISQRDGRSTESIIAESLRILRVLGVIAVIIAGSVIWLYRREFGDLSGPLAALAAPAVFFAARCNLWRAVAYAEGRVGLVARSELVASALRLLLTASAMALPLGQAIAFVLLAINVVTTWTTERLLHIKLRLSAQDRDTLMALMRYITPLIPEHVYYIVQGHLSILLLGASGSVVAVGELGALSRLGMLVSVLSIVNTGLFQPFVARHRSSRDFVFRSALVLVTWCVIGGVLFGIAYFFSEPFIAVLGPQYGHLRELVSLMVLVSVLTMLSAALYTIVLASGRPAALSLSIPVGLAVQATYVAVLGVATVERAIGFAFSAAISDLVVRALVLAREVWAMGRIRGNNGR